MDPLIKSQQLNLICERAAALHRRSLFVPCRCHADYFILHGTFYVASVMPVDTGLLARPKRFELLAPKFVVRGLMTEIIEGAYFERSASHAATMQIAKTLSYQPTF